MQEERLKENIVSMAKEGKTIEEIRGTLGLKSIVQVRNLYLEALMEQGAIPPLKSGKRRREIDVRTIGKRGSISLSRKVLIDMLGFKERDSFRIKREGDSIVLEKCK